VEDGWTDTSGILDWCSVAVYKTRGWTDGQQAIWCSVAVYKTSDGRMDGQQTIWFSVAVYKTRGWTDGQQTIWCSVAAYKTRGRTD